MADEQQSQQQHVLAERPGTLLLVTSPVPRVRVLAFNRPAKRNALCQALIDDFLRELKEASADGAVDAIVVTGSDTFFSAGADIKEISALGSEDARGTRYLADLCEGMSAVRKPVIAAVEGMALGGGFEVALMCDIILASTSSKFGLPEVTIGLLPGAGGTQRLTAAVGKFRAMKMILSGAPIAADEACSMGLVSQTHEPGTVLQKAVELASKIAANSPMAVGLAKEAVLRADEMGRDLEFERNLYYYAFGTKDKNEGVGAFLEKRPAKWT